MEEKYSFITFICNCISVRNDFLIMNNLWDYSLLKSDKLFKKHYIKNK